LYKQTSKARVSEYMGLYVIIFMLRATTQQQINYKNNHKEKAIINSIPLISCNAKRNSELFLLLMSPVSNMKKIFG